MKLTKFLLLTATAALLPAAVAAGPGGHGGGRGGQMGHGSSISATGPGAGMGHGPATRASQAGPTGASGSMGSTNGVGWTHSNGPDHETGQAFFECEDARPGHASSAPGSAFNPDGNAGTHYAGEQPQNSRNSSSVSQYDTACMHQPQH